MSRVRHLSMVAALLLGSCGETDGDDDFAAYKERCEQQTSEQDCVAQEEESEDGAIYSCTWARWVPVVLDSATGSCEFGAVQATCEVNLSADSCAGEDPNTCTAVDQIAVTREESGQLFLTKAGFCDGGTQMCLLDAGQWNVPECACACDPAYP